MRETKDDLRARAARIGKALARLYPRARISLDFKTPWQCLAATILSAQCTDERVNKVTPALFREFPDPYATAAASPHRIEQLIASTGFFRQKTKSLMGAARVIAERHGGRVPDTMRNWCDCRVSAARPPTLSSVTFTESRDSSWTPMSGDS